MAYAYGRDRRVWSGLVWSERGGIVRYLTLAGQRSAKHERYDTILSKFSLLCVLRVACYAYHDFKTD